MLNIEHAEIQPFGRDPLDKEGPMPYVRNLKRQMMMTL